MEFVILAVIVFGLGYVALDCVDEDLGHPKIKITFKK